MVVYAQSPRHLGAKLGGAQEGETRLRDIANPASKTKRKKKNDQGCAFGVGWLAFEECAVWQVFVPSHNQPVLK